MICAAAGVAPGPNVLMTVAVLSMVAPGGVPPATLTSNTTVTVPFAGTVMLETSRNPVPSAPVPAPVELFTAPAGKVTTLKELTLAGMSSVTRTPGARTPAVSRNVIV